MTTRAQLEEILATQRARRLRLQSPSPREKRGGTLLGVLAVIAILIASGAAMFFAVSITTSKSETIAAISPSAFPSTSIATTVVATPSVMKVCTDIPDGRLHVRFMAGDGSEVRGHLAEGETVQAAITSDNKLDSQTIRSELWLRILSPVAGWVNARYLCTLEHR